MTPMCLDRRLPRDTLYLVFEEDYRFFPEGEDIDGCDDYSTRLLRVIVDRGLKAMTGPESPPPQDATSSSTAGKCAGKGKPKPESRFHGTATRGSSDPSDEINEGFSSNVADLVRWATVAHRNKVGNFMWFGWNHKKKPSELGWGTHGLMLSKDGFTIWLMPSLQRRSIEATLMSFLSIGFCRETQRRGLEHAIFTQRWAATTAMLLAANRTGMEKPRAGALLHGRSTTPPMEPGSPQTRSSEGSGSSSGGGTSSAIGSGLVAHRTSRWCRTNGNGRASESLPPLMTPWTPPRIASRTGGRTPRTQAPRNRGRNDREGRSGSTTCATSIGCGLTLRRRLVWEHKLQSS